MEPVSFGKYTLLERINVGGMAEVFKAKVFGVEGFERIVALKRILPAISADSEFVDMFINEAKIAVQLNHSNIAQIFDLGKEKDSYFIAMEYIKGVDLRAIFDIFQKSDDPKMPLEQACFIVMRICEGLEYAHNKCDESGRAFNLVHRDISPQNVLVSTEGDVKIIDFGIAKISGSADITEAGVLKGKFGYMSPEQVKGKRVDRRSDIFSTGVILYELCTGMRLFYSESDVQTLDKVRHAEVIPPSIYSKAINPELERIILKSLAVHPSDRYANAVDLLDDLQSFVFASGMSYSASQLRDWMLASAAVEAGRNKKSKKYASKAKHASTSDTSHLSSSGSASSTSGGPDAATRIESSVSVRMRAKAMDSSARRLARDDMDRGHFGPTSSESSKPWSSDDWEAEDQETSIFEGPDPFGLEEIVANAGRDQPSRVSSSSHPRNGSASAAWKTTATFQSLKMRVNKVFEARLLRYLAWIGLITATLLIFLFFFRNRAEIRVFGEGTVDVLIDGQLFKDQSLPRKYSKLRVGYHNIEVRKPGFLPWRAEINLESGQSAKAKPFFQSGRVGTVDIRTSPPGSRVFLDKELLGKASPISVAGLAIGHHVVRIEKEGYQTKEQSFDIVFGKKMVLSIALDATEASSGQSRERNQQNSDSRNAVNRSTSNKVGRSTRSSAELKKTGHSSKKTVPKGGFLLVNSTPWTRLIIDGRETGLTTPQKRIALKAGKHAVRMVNAKYKIDRTFYITIRAGKAAKLIKGFSVASKK